MVPHMRVNGRVTNDMERVWLRGRPAVDTRVSGLMTKDRVMESLCGRIPPSMKESGKRINGKGKGCLCGRTVLSMKESGRMTLALDTEPLPAKSTNTKGNGSAANETAKVPSPGLMAPLIMESGGMIRKLDVRCCPLLRVLHISGT